MRWIRLTRLCVFLLVLIRVISWTGSLYQKKIIPEIALINTNKIRVEIRVFDTISAVCEFFAARFGLATERVYSVAHR
jgi:hypothetical protein